MTNDRLKNFEIQPRKSWVAYAQEEYLYRNPAVYNKSIHDIYDKQTSVRSNWKALLFGTLREQKYFSELSMQPYFRTVKILFY